jgi:predicted RNase H-like nuclease (RuvC/YqgF family)
MYKCLDEKGKVFYTDNPRVECYSGQEMNRQGVIVRKAGEKPAETGKVVKEDVKKAPRASSARRDRALLATYTSETEIDAARDRSLAMPQQSIKVLEGKLEKTNADLFELKKQADGLAAKQKSLPPDLLEDVQAKQKQIAALEKDLTQKRAHADEITTRFESDKQRFRELKGVTAAAATTKTN